MESDFAHALARGQFGVALLDERLFVLRRRGSLSDWLPGEGAPACSATLLLNMEESLRALAEQGGALTLPSVRLAEGPRMTVSIVFDPESRRYVVVTAPDHGGDQIDRLLASERRERRLLQEQAAAAQARLNVANALYRDIVESSADLVLRLAPDSRVTFANAPAARFLGLPREALLGRAAQSLFPGRNGADPWRGDHCAGAPASFELPARAADGAIRWLWWHLRWTGAEGGGEFQAIGRDVTEARRLRAERDKAHEEARAAAVASERLRIAQDLHDTLARSIVSLIAEARLIARRTPDDATRTALHALEKNARAGLDEVRAALTQMRQSPKECDPSEILDLFANRSALAQNIDIRAALEAPLDDVPAETAETICRTLREALRNVELHAGARRVEVLLRREGETLRLEVADDGAGFDPAAPVPGHYGLVGMRERAAAIGATLDIVSAPGAGTRVRLLAPAYSTSAGA